jgi:hypothetical protein
MTYITLAPARLPVIATFKKTCRAFLKALGPLGLLYLLCLGVLGVFSAGVIALGKPMASLAFALWRGLGLDLESLPFWLAMGPLILAFLVGFIAIVLWLSIAGYKLAYASADGRTLKLMDILRDPQPSILIYFLLNLGISILFLGGAILFIVPGIMIALALGLAPLAMIFEGKDLSESLQRSRDLTRNNRWRLLGLYLLFELLLLPSYLLDAVLLADDDTAFSPLSVLQLILNLAVSILRMIFSVVLTVTIYRELRALKDRPAEVVAPEPAPEPSPAA